MARAQHVQKDWDPACALTPGSRISNASHFESKTWIRFLPSEQKYVLRTALHVGLGSNTHGREPFQVALLLLSWDREVDEGKKGARQGKSVILKSSLFPTDVSD